MKARIKCAIAIGAACWLGPFTQAVAGVDVEAGDWKIDFQEAVRRLEGSPCISGFVRSASASTGDG